MHEPTAADAFASVVAVYMIGQTPRPDLTSGLAHRFGSARLLEVGALDGLSLEQIPTCPPSGYPLETLLRDGTRVVVDAAFLEPHLQDAITGLDDRVSAHVVLCAGSFPKLTALRPLLQPCDVAARTLAQRGFSVLEVLVPFAAQASSSVKKWQAAGFRSRVHVLDQKPQAVSIGDWLSDTLSDSDADALLFDYVGFPAVIVNEVAARVDVPVFDLGQLTLDHLERILETT